MKKRVFQIIIIVLTIGRLEANKLIRGAFVI